MASAGRTRAWTSGSDSPPGAQASGRAPAPGRELGAVARLAISSRWSPCQSPWPISRKPGSGRTRAGPAGLPERRRDGLGRLGRPPSGEWTSSSGAPAGTGRAGAACGAASRSATSAAWRRPMPVSGTIGLALEAALGDERRLAVADEDERRVEADRDRAAPSSAVSARSRGGSSTGRGRPPGSGSPPRRRAARRRRGPGS